MKSRCEVEGCREGDTIAKEQFLSDEYKLTSLTLSKGYPLTQASQTSVAEQYTYRQMPANVGLGRWGEEGSSSKENKRNVRFSEPTVHHTDFSRRLPPKQSLCKHPQRNMKKVIYTNTKTIFHSLYIVPCGGGGRGMDSDFFYFRLPASSSDKNSEMEFVNVHFHRGFWA